jgi:archaellum component FlaF (FlaF/FlaG flagellin family)
MRTDRVLLAGVIALVFSVAMAGRADAVLPNDFTIPSAKVSVTHETANCGSGTFVISCDNSSFDSDSYAVNATLNLSTQVDFDTDVTTNGLVIEFAPGTCADDNEPFFAQIIPGNAVHKTVNKTKTIYSFEGNVFNFFNFTFAHLEMNIQNPSGGGTPSLHVEANTNLCGLTAGPMAMIFETDLGESTDADHDIACVDVPAPSFNTLDVSSGVCLI